MLQVCGIFGPGSSKLAGLIQIGRSLRIGLHLDHLPDNNVPDNHVPDNHVPDNHVPDNHVPDDHKFWC